MFLPINKTEMQERGWAEADFVFVSGDAYVDHPSFGAAIITRLLESEGFRVCFLSQPRWDTLDDISRFGRPRLGFFVSSGNIDCMVAHYTAAKKKRSNDYFSPGNKSGLRPDRAVDVYCSLIRRAYGDIPVIIGGLEASLRRFAHYDYWVDKILPSILYSSAADLLVFGMGENQTREIARRLSQGEKISSMTDIKGTCYLTDPINTPLYGAECPSLANVSVSKREYAVSVRIQNEEHDHIRGKLIKQKHDKKMLVANIPMPPLMTEELDRIYELPFIRDFHPSYKDVGGVPAVEEVKFSITHNRGCFGACNFCSLAFHQGRCITVRSKESILKEATLLTKMPDFKGYIHDIGGPTANFRKPSCEKQKSSGLCKNKKCLAPEPCANLEVDHSEYLDILRSVRAIDGVKKVFVRSGVRYDYLLLDKDQEFFAELVKYHISGQLKVAPEHCSSAVLDKMGKPHIEAYLKFSAQYFSLSKKANLEQYIVPYLMSSHPGSTINDAVELALFLKHNKIRPEQVQDFYPTPGTISTAMFYTGLDPYTLSEVFVPKTMNEKALQRALIQYYEPKNHHLVIEALKTARRLDLIGNSKDCLINNPKSNPVSIRDNQKAKAASKNGSKKKKH